MAQYVFKAPTIRPEMLKYIEEKNPIIDDHSHALYKDQVQNQFKNIKLGKKKILGLPMKDWFLKPLEGTLNFLGHVFPVHEKREQLHNLSNFIDSMDSESSLQVFEKAITYEQDSIHVLLTMNMKNSIGGTLTQSFPDQLKEIAGVRDKYPARVLPFVALNPLDPDCESHFYMAMNLGYRGVKIYPCEGYLPSHPLLMRIFAICEKYGIPVITHGSSAALQPTINKTRVLGKILDAKGNIIDIDEVRSFKGDKWAWFNDPKHWIPVLEQYPLLRLDLAHFAGSEWSKYLKGVGRNWVSDILFMLPKYQNLYTDFAYTFHVPEYANGLKQLLIDNKLVRERVLWGSDYAMVLCECSFLVAKTNFINLMGDDLWNQIARINPKKFLL